MKFVGLFFLAVAAVIGIGTYHTTAGLNFRTEGSPAGTAMLIIPLGGFGIAFLSGVIGLGLFFGSSKRQDPGSVPTSHIPEAPPGLAGSRPLASDESQQKPEQRWLMLGNASLGIARLPDQRCWLVLRGPVGCVRAQERGNRETSWLTLLLGNFTVRIPSSWTLSPEMAQAVIAACEDSTPMPEGIAWFACEDASHWHNLGPWQGWGEVASALTPQRVVRNDWVFALAASHALLRGSELPAGGGSVERWERQDGKKMGLLANGERALLLVQQRVMGEMRCALDPDAPAAFEMVPFALDKQTLWVPHYWTLPQNDGLARMAQFNHDGTQDLNKFATPVVAAVSRTPWIDLAHAPAKQTRKQV